MQEKTSCDGVIVPADETMASSVAKRNFGKASSRQREIAELNGLDGKGSNEGGCLALP